MDYLFEGVKNFNNTDFEQYRTLFQYLRRRQSPHTLFIGCSDSRIVPNLITQTLPGELFVIRNIANIVPVYRETQEFLATTSAIEYAVQILNVKNIIVCGHSNCGGCHALFEKESELNKIPHTKKWLELAMDVKRKIESEKIIDSLELEWKTEQLNIVEQLNHLMTFPYIKEKYENGSMNIYGWYYIIQSGDVFNYDKEKNEFVKI